ncbi:calcium-binding protein [Nocardioides sp. BP30]|uniref:calcium-binding protein n=1 Tax=Nocardioides sp. BP30 TaxID=3036374 RepID=UPI0024698220|nr:calcium-binding protein [Nocardioides sp. BP30]WGL52345.1 calcium-binding protein [Nocardioides sp. BP30]
MHHLFRRIAVPALAAGLLTVPALGAAYADGGSTAAGDAVPAGLVCNGVAPTLWATADNQTITGTPGNDVIAANGFHGLTIRGGAGDDQICGANDPAGTASNTTLDGGDGNDTLISTGGRDRLIGGAGNDRLTGTINNDVVYTTDGYTAGAAGITVNLAAGTVTGARSGTDTLSGLDQARIFGTDGNDLFLGDDAANWFDGGAGADEIHGYGGDDWFHAVNPKYVGGNAGNDTVTVGYGGTVAGGKGDDTIAADPNNQLSGASADSGTPVTGYTLSGNTGDDTFKIGTLKTDATTWSTAATLHWKGTVSGGKGTDAIDFSWLGDKAALRTSIAAGTANWALGHIDYTTTEKIVGTPGDDLLKGGSGNDILYGQEGDDTLRGRHGNDNLHGKQGDDLILGGVGTDKANGGQGSDTCKSAEHAKACEYH